MNIDGIEERTWQLLEILADGHFHSGELLAAELGISRASVFNALTNVTEYGVALQRVRGRGYRLDAWQPLKLEEVQRWLGEEAIKFDIEILRQAASSNVELLQRTALGAKSGSVLAVEMQTGGRGRLGRSWHSGLGNALTFSLLWRFDCGLNALSGLSLAVGVSLVRALDKLGITGTKLKWPNDLLTEQGKLAGVLIEAQGDMLGPCAVVIGIGLNHTLPNNLIQQIDQPAIALDELCTFMPSRNQLLAAILCEMGMVLRQFANNGFPSLRTEWERFHAFQNQPIRLHMADGIIVNGIARGINDKGELSLETEKGIRNFNSGEIGI